MTGEFRYGNYVVISSAAKMPSSCRGRYGRVAIMKTATPGTQAKKIADTVQYWPVRTWERLNIGRTKNCAFQRALAEAKAHARQLFLFGE